MFEPGLDPSIFPNEKLFYWTARPRNPVLACNDDLANMFIQAMVTGEAVEFVYFGGSEPGRTRSVKVFLVFQHEPKGRVYVSGYYHGRLDGGSPQKTGKAVNRDAREHRILHHPAPDERSSFEGFA